MVIAASRCGLLVLCVGLTLATTAEAQQTTSYTNRWGDTVTDTRSRQNGTVTNDRTVTTPNGKTFTNDRTASRDSNGRPVVQDTRTRPNGKSVNATTTYGRFRDTRTITGPNGGSRTFYRRR